MAKIIGSINAKGGPGKTTFACNAGIYYQKQGFDVLLVDTDDEDQNSLRFWMNNRDEDDRLPVVHISDHVTLKRDLPKLMKAYDRIVIDGGPGSNRARVLLNTSIVKVADLVVVPVEPSPLDVDRLDTTISLIEVCQEARGGLPIARALINGIDRRSNGHDLARDMIENLGLDVLSSMLPALQEIKMSPGYGTGLVEEKGKSAVIFSEIMQEVEGLING